MENFENFENFIDAINESSYSMLDKEVIMHIKNARGISDEMKEFALKNRGRSTRVRKSIITGIELNAEMVKHAKSKGCPVGYDIGIDKNGFFIHTHRARSASHEKIEQISAKEMKFIDSTG